MANLPSSRESEVSMTRSRVVENVTSIVIGVAMMGALDSALGFASSQASGLVTCRPTGPLIALPDLPEASGVTASQRRPGTVWAHNDSGEAVIFGVDTTGVIRDLVRPHGASVVDWEDIAIGPCPQGSCLYIGDIGDNDATRNRITIYRIPEPAPGVSDVSTEAFHATYPDGAKNAEALFVDSKGGVFIVSKGDNERVALYRFPISLRPGATVQLQQVGNAQPVRDIGQITGASTSVDGRYVILRTGGSLVFYRTEEFLRGSWRRAATVNLQELNEPQGEGVAASSGNVIFVVGEGRGEARPGTLSRLSCTFQP
jgi:hypothetical protein